MDFLRSCYRGKIRYVEDFPEITADVQWYFVPEANGTLPFASSFSSRIYDLEDSAEPEIGEQNKPRPWRGGLPPYAVSFGGLCGTASEWLNGVSILKPLPPTWPDSSIPICCAPPPPVVGGAIEFGGGLQPCQLCRDDPYIGDLVATFQVLEGDCPELDGMSYDLVQGRYGCGVYTWMSPPIAVTGDYVGIWQFGLFCLSSNKQYYSWGPGYIGDQCPNTLSFSREFGDLYSCDPVLVAFDLRMLDPFGGPLVRVVITSPITP